MFLEEGLISTKILPKTFFKKRKIYSINYYDKFLYEIKRKKFAQNFSLDFFFRISTKILKFYINYETI